MAAKRWLSYNKIYIFVFLILLIGSHRLINLEYTDDTTYDEGTYTLGSYYALLNKNMYEDFFFPEPPLVPYLGAVFMSFVGVGLVQLRFLAVFCSIMTGLSMFCIVRMIFKKPWQIYAGTILAVLPFYLDKIPNFYSKIFFMEPFVTFLIVTTIFISLKKSKTSAFCSGILGCSAILVKFFGVVAIATVFVYLLLKDRKNLKFFIFGCAVISLPFLIYLIEHQNILQPLLYFHLKGGGQDYQPILKSLTEKYIFIPWIALISIPFLLYKRRYPVLVWLIVTLLFLFFVFKSAEDHKTYYLIPIFSLASSVFIVDLKNKKIFLWIAIIIVLGFYFYSIFTVANFEDIKTKLLQKGNGLTQIAKYIQERTNVSDKILSDYPMVPFLAKREVIGDTVDVSNARVERGFMNESYIFELVKNEKPKFIVVESRFKRFTEMMSFIEKNYSSKKFDSINVYERI
jgi:4-amino-4-deoxy-L-arabinose transferase-like glycosyltransferase